MSGQPGESPDADVAKTANEAVKAIGTVAVTFLVTMLYLGITAASTTHAQLLRGRVLRLPLLDVEVPVVEFFRIAPLLVVALHLMFLLQVLFLYRRLREPGVRARRDLVMPSIFSEDALPREPGGALAVAVRLVVFMLTQLIPLGLLALMQVRFLPYHEPSFTRWFHQVPMLGALALCAWFGPQILSRDGTWRGFWRPPRDQGRARIVYFGATRLVVLAAWLSFFVFSWCVAVVPGGGRPEGGVAGAWVEPDIEVSGRRLVDAQSWRPEPNDALRSSSLDLSRRDLRNADFSHAVLTGVDLRGADLRGASFVGADLRGADFSSPTADEPGAKPLLTDLTGADLTGAVLGHARLKGAVLRSSTFTRADLENAVLDDADLRRADLSSARLEGATLRYARLTGAVLEGASIGCADLYAVDAEGLWAVDVVGPRADLRRARLSGATFVGADLRASELADVVAVGGDFRGADLRGSRGLPLIGLDLRGADLTGSVVGGWLLQALRLVDARGALLETSALSDQPGRCPPRDRASPAAERLRDPLPVLELLRHSPPQDSLLDRADLGGRRLTETQYYDRLLTSLLRRREGPACRSTALAATLALRASGCGMPRDGVLEEHLLPRVRDLVKDATDCPAFAALGEDLRFERPPAPTPEDAVDLDWPRSPGAPPWGWPRAGCDALRGALWKRVLDEPT